MRSPFRPAAPSTGGWTDGPDGNRERKEIDKESFGHERGGGNRSREKDGGGGCSNGHGFDRPNSASAVTKRSMERKETGGWEGGEQEDEQHREHERGLSMHQRYRQQQQTLQQEYLQDRPYIPVNQQYQQHQQTQNRKHQAMPSDLSYDYDDNDIITATTYQQSSMQQAQSRTMNANNSFPEEHRPHRSGVGHDQPMYIGHSECRNGNGSDFAQPEVFDERIRAMGEQQAALQSRQEERRTRQQEQDQQRLEQREQDQETRRLQEEARQYQQHHHGEEGGDEMSVFSNITEEG